jgi:DNA-binding transcriptional MerR regulator
MKEEYYNINDLEKLTGIKAHTIRIWEKRFNLLYPVRSDTNIRFYSANDLKKLLNISILNKNGLKISRIAELKETEINEKVIELTTRNSDTEDQVQGLIMAMFNLNIQKFEKLLTVSYINRGFENTYTEIIAPFLTKVGFLWQTGTISPVQEHFASSIIRRKIVVAIDGLLASYSEKSKSFLLFLPEGEQHEISLLFSYYLLKKNNQHVTYLGSSVPFANIDEVNSFHKSDYLVTSFTSAYSIKRVQEYIEQVATRFSDQKIITFGPQMELFNSPLPNNAIKVSTIQDFISQAILN